MSYKKTTAIIIKHIKQNMKILYVFKYIKEQPKKRHGNPLTLKYKKKTNMNICEILGDYMFFMPEYA